MKIESEHNGIKFGDKCWAWDCNDSVGKEVRLTGYIKDHNWPFKVVDDQGHSKEFKFARPLKTEAEKVLDAFKGQKICRKEWDGKETHFTPQSIDSYGRFQSLRNDGATIYLNVSKFEDWQLWAVPKVVLATRRVAGWWCKRIHWHNLHQVQAPSLNGASCRINGERFNFMVGDPACEFVFSKDPMTPLDQWTPLEEICREAQA